MDYSEEGAVALDRALSEQEQCLLIWMLEHGAAGSLDFLYQALEVRVEGGCECGCPTIYLSHHGVPVHGKAEFVISDHVGEVDGKEVGVLVFQHEGHLSSLEVYSFAGHEEPFGLPEVSTLHAFGQ